MQIINFSQNNKFDFKLYYSGSDPRVFGGIDVDGTPTTIFISRDLVTDDLIAGTAADNYAEAQRLASTISSDNISIEPFSIDAYLQLCEEYPEFRL